MRYARTFVVALAVASGAPGVIPCLTPALETHGSAILTLEDHIIIIFDGGEVVI
jgi:hypothetical protein